MSCKTIFGLACSSFKCSEVAVVHDVVYFVNCVWCSVVPVTDGRILSFRCVLSIISQIVVYTYNPCSTRYRFFRCTIHGCCCCCSVHVAAAGTRGNGDVVGAEKRKNFPSFRCGSPRCTGLRESRHMQRQLPHTRVGLSQAHTDDVIGLTEFYCLYCFR